MKKHAATLLILALVALPGLVNAQSRHVIKADVPFAFVVNGKTMPAGECTIETRGDGTPYLWISSGNQGLFAIPHRSDSLKPSDETKLVFNRYGDRYFLSEISREGESRGYQLPAGKLERELRAQNVAQSSVTLLASAE